MTFNVLASVGTLAAAEGSQSQSPLLPAIYDIVWSIIPFALVLIVFYVFVAPRFNRTLEERRAKIEGGIEHAAKVQAEADAKAAENERVLAEARAEASEIREQAKAEADEIRAERKAATQAELDRMTESAKAHIEAERQSAIVSLRQEVGDIAVSLASGVVGQSLSDDVRSKAYVDRFLGELESQAPTSGANR